MILSETGRLAREESDLSVSFAEEIDRLPGYRDWNKAKFAQKEFGFINKRAYFDYQQERVYLRSSKIIKKAKINKYISPNRSLPVSQKIIITASKCPVCKSGDIISGVKKKVRTQEPRVKRAFDLVFNPSGVRRRVIGYKTSVHKCLKCNEEFIPPEYQRLDKYFHGLKSWVIFQHVEYKIHLSDLSRMLEDFFGIHLANHEVFILKTLMARYYEATYKRLLEKIVAGNLLHVDETKVELQDQKGYIWVFTNLEEVVYLYRSSREGDFLHGLLKDFKGVLVSDFYAAYDGVKSLQQKCLVHLIRDMNQDLLNNPFDDELKLITQPFGMLVRKIVETIDKYGLKKKYMIRHSKEVEVFFESIDKLKISSDTAEALRARLIKNRHKRFEFINHDGIPWNNNNAEHAIKQFAYYREIYNGFIKEIGVKKYLVLLSICQTCHYKGLDFLKFLLSKEKDIDVFSKRSHKNYNLSNIEFYPEEFWQENFGRKHKKREK